MRTRWVAALSALALVAACSGSGGGGDAASGATAATEAAGPATTAPAAATPVDDTVDRTRLPVGDDSVSSSETGVGLLCTTMPGGGGGASTQGPWFNGDGTFNDEAKYVVEGDVQWTQELDVTVEGDTRVIATNNLPDHTTGVFPVEAGTQAAEIDRNPNSISEQSFTLELPANPTVADEPTCLGGEAGILLSGVVLNNAVDAALRDAVAWEVRDSCDGHPHGGGVYHYHSLSDCITDETAGTHSDLVGYALDGFGIFGHYGEDGTVLTNADLDECHGHTHEVEWDGETVEMYHYHATYEFPYTVGCFRGTTVASAAGVGGGGGAGGPA
ncbi:MAG TPA: YHYH protein, partial [Acidimicrobiia bacterium]